MTRERENTGWQAWTKNGSEYWRCDQLVTYEYTMNSACMNNSSAMYNTCMYLLVAVSKSTRIRDVGYVHNRHVP